MYGGDGIGDIANGFVLIFQLLVSCVVIMTIALIYALLPKNWQFRKKEIKDSNYKNAFMIFILAMIIYNYIKGIINGNNTEYFAIAEYLNLSTNDAFIMMLIEFTTLMIAVSLIYYLLYKVNDEWYSYILSIIIHIIFLGLAQELFYYYAWNKSGKKYMVSKTGIVSELSYTKLHEYIDEIAYEVYTAEQEERRYVISNLLLPKLIESPVDPPTPVGVQVIESPDGPVTVATTDPPP